MTTIHRPPARKPSGLAVAAFLLLVLLPAAPALYFNGRFGFPLFVVLGTVLGVLALRQILARGQKRLTLVLISLAFAAMWICWAVLETWM